MTIDHRIIAESALMHLTNRLNRDVEYADLYCQAIEQALSKYTVTPIITDAPQAFREVFNKKAEE